MTCHISSRSRRGSGPRRNCMDHKLKRHMPHVEFPLFVSHFSHCAIGIKQDGEREGEKTLLTGLG
jgi:hypothetical protein